ncbi:MAG: hypothetical protein H7246_19235, partial [Phycisphaerae bacterium]|nr:hypothetical protein [Saprospiraceae bacterium]
MKEHYTHKQRFSLLLLFVFVTFCSRQGKTPLTKNSISESNTNPAEQIKIYGSVPDPFLDGQISQYVRRIFQDKNGNLWLGTNGDGVCRYDPAKGGLTYFTTTEGFGGHAVRGIVEDASGNIWFATDGGVCRYDGSRANYPCNNNSCKHNMQTEKGYNEHSKELAKSFINYTMKDGLGSDQVWSILIDRDGHVWCGTEGGAARFDEKNLPTGQAGFTSFPIPAADLKDYPNAYPAPKLINCIVQDNTGNIWFGSNGNGAYRYDGTTLTNISEKDGLCNNVVQCILEDRNGNFWFGSRFGGLSRYDPSTGGFTNF